MGHFSEQNLMHWMPDVQAMARAAGAIILDFYKNGITAETKGDGTPVTQADKASHQFITAGLQRLTPGIAIISEENDSHPEIKDNEPFWTVDPLDGTSGFIRHNDFFFVKIALLENFKPVLGVIYQPVGNTLFFSHKNSPAFRWAPGKTPEIIVGRTIPPAKKTLSTLFNELHHDPNAYDAAHSRLTAHGIPVQPRHEARGLCSTVFHVAVAAGEADVYIDCGRTTDLQKGNGYVWDYAPDWLILKNAGGVMVDIHAGQETGFRDPAQKRNAMIGLGDRNFGGKLFPKLENGCV